MSTVTTKRTVATLGIAEADMDRAKAILKTVTPDKMLKKFNRNVNDNKKLDAFLSGNFTIPKAFNPDTLGATINSLLEPKKHEHHGLTNVEQQKLILKLLEADILSVEIAAKQAWIASFSLDEEQITKASDVLAKYEKMLRGAITQGTKAWRKVYGE